jgi:threonine aldolase
MTVLLTETRGFESDNCSTVHPRIMRALERANRGHASSYGGDPITAEAEKVFDAVFGRPVDVFLTLNGTGTNCAALAHLIKPYQAIVCADTAHINCAETGAPERIAGGKLIGLPAPDGKVKPELLLALLGGWQSEHVALPSVLSLTQVSDEGTVYSPGEISELCRIAHSHGMKVHMDGARLANAVVANGGDLGGTTWSAGVDVLSFGGTKNGLMFGEAVVFFDQALSGQFKYTRKSCGQLASKMRYIAAQFVEALSDGLWLEMAGQANAMALRLFEGMNITPGFRAPYRPQANELFAFVEAGIRDALRARYSFLDMGPEPGISRFVTSFDTQPEDVDDFLAYSGTLTIH